jgi:hypothetical protein
MWLKQAIVYKKAALTELVERPLAELAKACGARWLNPEALDALLAAHLDRIPHCHLLYAVDTGGAQVSGNVSAAGVDGAVRGQDLGERPFHAGSLPYRGLVLSPIYISRVSRKRCITALHAVTFGGELLGFVAADFNLEDVPLPEVQAETGAQWTQYKGDPAIRSGVFDQARMPSRLDGRIDEVVATIDVLMREHGIYHVILHFSSSRAIFWVYDDPYKYRFHGIDEVLDPEIWLAYPPQAYPAEARVAPGQIRTVLEQFRQLRMGDENIYLRSASLNVMNGIIGLTFSCDGSHYMTVDEFLNKDHPFWA